MILFRDSPILRSSRRITGVYGDLLQAVRRGARNNTTVQDVVHTVTSK